MLVPSVDQRFIYDVSADVDTTYSSNSGNVVKRLKGLKSPFRKLLHTQGNLYNRVDLLRKELDETQKAIDKDPHNPDLREEHAHYLLAFKEASLNEESQKAEFMVREVTNTEIKEAIFSMRDDKAPGPDGFTSAFFKKAWDVVGINVTNVIQDFFINGKLLKEINHTIISLVPKVSTLARINDYRPISCCDVLFKCISKIIGNRIKGNHYKKWPFGTNFFGTNLMSRAEELETALIEVVKQDNRRQLSAKVEKLKREVAELHQALSCKQEQENAMLQVLMRVEQEQRVTQDARIYAEQDAAAQRYAAQVLQYVNRIGNDNVIQLNDMAHNLKACSLYKKNMNQQLLPLLK
uniref:RNA-directed DNA polymerase, eukaryota, reverse transcriptase zinc-binding domain protein n=1 Tax=Tanacetum cinerariifolium TaxID=118510 RepID=A0A6L2M434_TANCI|nr:hypothetical protein [Tanacetum cinerariifolium]